MQAVILAGGLGQRLRPFTEVIPKPLLPLGEKSILEIQINALAAAGAREVFLATNYMSDFIEAFIGDGSKFGVPVHVSKETERLGTCGPLTLLRDRLDSPFIVMNGDILTKLDFGAFARTAAEDPADLVVGTKVITTPFRFGNVTVSDDGAVLDVDEKPEFVLEILSGIYHMKPSIFRFIPEGEYFGMDGLIKKMLGMNERVGRFLIKDYWLDIGQVDDYSTAQAEYAREFEDGSAGDGTAAS